MEMYRKLAATTATALFLLTFQGGTSAHAVGVCGGGPRTQKPMSVTINLETSGLEQAVEFTYQVSGPNYFTGTIMAKPGSYRGSVNVNGLERGWYTVSMGSDITPSISTELHVVPPGCGNSVDFTFALEPSSLSRMHR